MIIAATYLLRGDIDLKSSTALHGCTSCHHLMESLNGIIIYHINSIWYVFKECNTPHIFQLGNSPNCNLKYYALGTTIILL